MNKIKIVLGYLLSFMASCVIAFSVLLLIAKINVFNKNYILKKLDDNNYYDKIYNEINEEMELHLLSTGFNKEILKDIYTKDEVIEDVNMFINDVFDGNITILDKSNIRHNIKMNIDNFFKKTKLSVMNKNDLNKFVNDLVNIYKDEICLYGFADSIIIKIPKLNKIINYGFCLMFAIMFILMVILFKYVIINYYGSIIISSGLIILFMRLFVLEKIDIDSLLIITENFSEVLRIAMKTITANSLFSSLLLIFIGIVVIIFESMCKVKKKKLIND